VGDEQSYGTNVWAELDPMGDAVQFPRGLAGAHQVRNDTDEPVRVVIFAYHGTPDVIEYLDGGVTIVGARTPSADGEPLFRRFPAE
jgi:uncharacterized cupin superfamily protein